MAEVKSEQSKRSEKAGEAAAVHPTHRPGGTNSTPLLPRRGVEVGQGVSAGKCTLRVLRTGGEAFGLLLQHAYPTLPYPTLPYPTLPYPTLPYWCGNTPNPAFHLYNCYIFSI